MAAKEGGGLTLKAVPVRHGNIYGVLLEEAVIFINRLIILLTARQQEGRCQERARKAEEGGDRRARAHAKAGHGFRVSV